MDLFQVSNLKQTPLIKINKWLKEAIDNEVPLPHAMTLATVHSSGKPSSRMVLLKAISDKGLTFYTDYSSRKGVEIKNNGHTALNFWWAKTGKQIRVEGICHKTNLKDSENYFNARPRGSKVSAFISNQSEEIKDYKILIKKAKELEESLLGEEINRPERWGGFLLEPVSIEFWTNKPNRLHLRELFSWDSDQWKKTILSP